MIYDLIDAYDLAIRVIPKGHGSHALLSTLKSALVSDVGALTVLPTTLIQSLNNWCEVRNRKSEPSSFGCQLIGGLLADWQDTQNASGMARPFFQKICPHPAFRTPIPEQIIPLTELAHSISAPHDGNGIALGYSTGRIDVLERDLITHRLTLAGHGSEVLTINWSKCGQTLYSASTDKALHVWDTVDGSLLAHFELPGRPYCSALSKCGKYLAFIHDANFTRSSNQTASTSAVTIWNTETMSFDNRATPDFRCPSTLDWSPNEDTLVVGSEDGSIEIWRSTARVNRIATQFPVRCVRCDTKSNRVAFLVGNSIGLWDVTRETIVYYDPSVSTHQFSDKSPEARMSESLPRLPEHFAKTLPAGFERQARNVIDLLTDQQEKSGAIPVDVAGTRSELRQIEWFDERTLIVAAYDGTIWRLEVASDNHVCTSVLGTCLNSCPEFEVIDSGRIVALDTGSTSHLSVWDISSTISRLEFPRMFQPSGAASQVQCGWNCDGTVFAIWAKGIPLKLWRLHSNRLSELFIPHTMERADYLTWSNVDRDLAVVYSDSDAFLFDAASGTVTDPIKVQNGWTKTAFSKNEQLVAIVNPHGIALLASNNGKLVAQACLQHDQPSCIEFSPTLNEVAVGHFSGKLSIMSIASFPDQDNELTQLAENSLRWPVLCIQYSPCGEFIAVGSQSGEIQIWRARLCEQLIASEFGSAFQVLRLHWKEDSSAIAATLLFVDNRPSVVVFDVTTSQQVVHVEETADALGVLNWLYAGSELLLLNNRTARLIDGCGNIQAEILIDGDQCVRSDSLQAWIVSTKSTTVFSGVMTELRPQSHLLVLLQFNGRIQPTALNEDSRRYDFIRSQGESRSRRIVRSYLAFEPAIQMAFAMKKWDKALSLIDGWETALRVSNDNHAILKILRARLHAMTELGSTDPKSHIVLEVVDLLRRQGDTQEVATMLLNAATELRVEGRCFDALKTLEEAEAILVPTGFQQALVTCLYQKSRLLSLLGMYAIALEELRRLEGALEERDFVEALAEALDLHRDILTESLGDRRPLEDDSLDEIRERRITLARRLQARTEAQWFSNLAEEKSESGNIKGGLYYRNQAVTVLRAAGDRLNLAKNLQRAGCLLGAEERYEEASEYLSEAVRLFTEVLEFSEAVAAGATLAYTLRLLGDNDGAYRVIIAAEKRCRDRDICQHLPDVLIERAEQEYEKGDRVLCARCIEEALSLSEFNEDLTEKARIINLLTRAYMEGMDLSKANAAVTRGVEVCVKSGQNDRLVTSLGDQELILRGLGRFEEALVVLKHQESLARRLGDARATASSLIDQGITLMQLGRYSEADDQLRVAVEYCRDNGVERALPFSLLQRAKCLKLLENIPIALQVALEAQKTAILSGVQRWVDLSVALVEELGEL